MKQLILILMLSLAGCSTTSYAPKISSENSGQVTLIRERAEPTAWNVSFYINDKKYVSLSNSSYATFNLDPGKYNFRFTWPALASQVGLIGDLEILPNSKNHLLFTSAVNVTGYSYNAFTGSGVMYSNPTSSLRKITSKQSKEIISRIDK